MQVYTEEFMALKIVARILGERNDLTESEISALVRAQMAIGKAEERLSAHNAKQAKVMRERRSA